MSVDTRHHLNKKTWEWILVICFQNDSQFEYTKKAFLYVSGCWAPWVGNINSHCAIVSQLASSQSLHSRLPFFILPPEFTCFLLTKTRVGGRAMLNTKCNTTNLWETISIWLYGLQSYSCSTIDIQPWPTAAGLCKQHPIKYFQNIWLQAKLYYKFAKYSKWLVSISQYDRKISHIHAD